MNTIIEKPKYQKRGDKKNFKINKSKNNYNSKLNKIKKNKKNIKLKKCILTRLKLKSFFLNILKIQSNLQIDKSKFIEGEKIEIHIIKPKKVKSTFET